MSCGGNVRGKPLAAISFVPVPTLIDVRLLQWGASPAAFCEHVNELGATEVVSQEITMTLVALRV